MRNVRVRYNKTGDARFVSHLDLVRAFGRAIRRAGLDVWYTEGFNPHIKINFLPPLSLGYESVCEAFDIRMNDDTPDAVIAERLRAVLPDILRVTDAYGAETDLSDVASVRYSIDFAGDTDEALGLIAGGGLIIEKRTKRGSITVDISETVLSAENVGGKLEVVLPMCEGSVNPRYVVEALNTYGNMGITDFRCVRRELYAADGSVFR